MELDSKGNLIISGHIETASSLSGPSYESRKFELFLMKVSAEGTWLWTRVYNNDARAHPYVRQHSLSIAPDDSLVQVGYYHDGYNGFINRYDSAGNITWTGATTPGLWGGFRGCAFGSDGKLWVVGSVGITPPSTGTTVKIGDQLLANISSTRLTPTSTGHWPWRKPFAWVATMTF